MSAAARGKDAFPDPRPPRRLYALLVAASALSALLGFAREAAVGALFGASRGTDAFYAAFSIPFVAAWFLVGGALAPSLTAELARRLAGGDAGGARGVLAAALRSVAGAAVLVSAALALLAPQVARLLAPGFDPAASALLARLLRILVGYGILTSLALLASAALLAAGAYVAPALSQLLGNAVALGAMLLLAGRGIEGAALAVVLGSAVALAALVPPLARARLLAPGTRGLPLPWRDSTLLALSLAASGAVDLLERPFASTVGIGAVAILAFASKLVHLPMRLVAAPLASVSFPRLVRGGRSGGAAVEASEAAGDIVRLLAFAAAVTGGAAAPIAVIAFGRGRFDAAALHELARALTVLAPAVVAIGFLEVGTRYLLADGRARLVVAAHVAGLVAYAIAAPLLVARGITGLAAARDLAWGAAALGLAWPLARRGVLPARDALLSLAAALVAALAAALVTRALTLPNAAVLGAALAVSAAVFAPLVLRARRARVPA